MKIHNNKKNIIRGFLGISIIVFGFLWKPETQTTQFGQYFLMGNLMMLVLLMEGLPLYFAYKYRHILAILSHFSATYEHEPLSYSYTPVVLIKSNIHDQDNTTHLIQTQYLSEKTLFTIYHEGQLFEFSTDIVDQQRIIDLASVIIYYLQNEVPYEILHQHSKRLQHIL